MSARKVCSGSGSIWKIRAERRTHSIAGAAMDELLRLSAIRKSYRRGPRRLAVLADVSLTVAAREIVAVVGSRYEGKTTLLKIAAGLERPDAGEVWFGDQELSRLRAREREGLL